MTGREGEWRQDGRSEAHNNAQANRPSPQAAARPSGRPPEPASTPTAAPEALTIPGRRRAIWGYGLPAGYFLLLGLGLPILFGRDGLGWMLPVLALGGWLGLQAWGHAVLRIDVGRAGMRLWIPDETADLLHPPVRCYRFLWSEVSRIALLEGRRAPGADDRLRRWLLGPPPSVLLIVARGRRLRLSSTMVGGFLLDVAELVAALSETPVEADRPFAPGDPDLF